MEEIHTGNPVQAATLFGNYKLPEKTTRKTERGELLRYFSQKIGRPIPFVATKLAGLKLPDLYFIKSDCDQAEHRGIPWSAAFYSSLKPR